MEVREITKNTLKTRPKIEVEEMIKKWKKEYEKPVKGKFEFEEARGTASGATFSFTERVFPGTPVQVYQIRHDEMCIIPKGVAVRLNNTKQKIRVQNMNIEESGTVRGVPSTFERYSRVKFTPEEYL